MFLKSAMFQLSRPGPRREFFATLPKIAVVVTGYEVDRKCRRIQLSRFFAKQFFEAVKKEGCHAQTRTNRKKFSMLLKTGAFAALRTGARSTLSQPVLVLRELRATFLQVAQSS